MTPRGTPCVGPLGVAVLAGLACAGSESDGTLERHSVMVGTAMRTYLLHAPPGAGGGARPLLMAFHGTGESGAAMRRATALDTLGIRYGFLVAYPDAAVGNWAEGCDCSRADLAGIDDTGFVRALVDDVARRYPIDRGRVYAAGFSQGGLFVQRVACEMADLVSAVASVAAPMSTRLAQTCAPSRPVGILVLQGTLDDAYPYEGRRGGGRSLLGARETARLWRALNACPGDARVREWPDRAADGTRLLEEWWERCRAGAAVRLFTVEGGRHAWTPSGDVETETLLADHFRPAREPH